MSEKIKVKKSPEILKYRAQKCKNIRLQGLKRILYIWTEPDWNPSIFKAIGRGGVSGQKIKYRIIHRKGLNENI
jgi:hypothetical protein